MQQGYSAVGRRHCSCRRRIVDPPRDGDGRGVEDGRHIQLVAGVILPRQHVSLKGWSVLHSTTGGWWLTALDAPLHLFLTGHSLQARL